MNTEYINATRFNTSDKLPLIVLKYLIIYLFVFLTEIHVGKNEFSRNVFFFNWVPTISQHFLDQLRSNFAHLSTSAVFV